MKGLLDEIALREASLLDAADEFARGELDEARYALIRAREEAALVLARSRLQVVAEAAPRRGRVRRRAYLVVAALGFLVALLVILAGLVVPRQPGTSITGSVSLSRSAHVAQLLSEAEADIANADAAAALAAYEQVLGLEPSNVTALTQAGWLSFSAGAAARSPSAVRAGLGELRRAIEYGPSSSAAHLYYAIAAASTPGNRALALAQFRQFLALRPSAAQRAVAQPFLAQLHLAP